jgi:hypothetical protein
MKTSKIFFGLFSLMTLMAINGLLVTTAKAQDTKCTAAASNIYFVDSGQTVVEVHPGSNGGNGYQLNILGKGADSFEVVKERFMTTLYIIPNYTNATAAKWEIEFAPKMARMIPTIRMKNKCTGETKEYRLDTKIKLLDQ